MQIGKLVQELKTPWPEIGKCNKSHEIRPDKTPMIIVDIKVLSGEAFLILTDNVTYEYLPARGVRVMNL